MWQLKPGFSNRRVTHSCSQAETKPGGGVGASNCRWEELPFRLEASQTTVNTLSFAFMSAAGLGFDSPWLSRQTLNPRCSKRVSPDVVSYSAMITCCETLGENDKIHLLSEEFLVHTMGG